MNYFRLEMSTEWCGTENSIIIETLFSQKELESKYGESFDEEARENLLSFMSEEEINEDGYEIEEAFHWSLKPIKLEEFLEAVEDDEVINFLE